MRILVTGAAGFIGAALIERLARREDVEHVIAVDQAEPRAPSNKVETRIGDLGDSGFARALVNRRTELVFHLASLVSGGAEQDFELGYRINLDGTRHLLESCRLAGHSPRLVFASSIAVYGGELPDPVTDDTPASPRLSYGAQKLVCEILINDYARRGLVDGRSLRLPTVLVRPGAANTALSGWASALVREPLAGRDYVCPVGPETRMACLSLERTLDALLHAATLPADALGEDRGLLLSAIGVPASEIAEAARRAGAGRRLGRIRFQPDAAVQSIIDRVPRATRSRRAAALGFRHDESIDAIVMQYLERTESTHAET